MTELANAFHPDELAQQAFGFYEEFSTKDTPKALLDGVQRENWIRVESQSWPRCPSERIFPEIHICFPATKAGGFTLKNREHTNAT